MNMNIRLALICSALLTARAADLPYAGKWKVNLAKSDFGETTLLLESSPGDEWQSTAFGVTYKFKMDRKDWCKTQRPFELSMAGRPWWSCPGANKTLMTMS